MLLLVHNRYILSLLVLIFSCLLAQEQERVKTQLQCISEDLARLKEERNEERLPEERDEKRLSLPPDLQVC